MIVVEVIGMSATAGLAVMLKLRVGRGCGRG
jgi:hypothetical protein